MPTRSGWLLGEACWRRRRRANATGTSMSLKTVQLIVGRLVTDEEYRLKFLSDPIHALTTLRDQGVELTSAEIDALIRTDRTLWSDAAARIDRDRARQRLDRVLKQVQYPMTAPRQYATAGAFRAALEARRSVTNRRGAQFVGLVSSRTC